MIAVTAALPGGTAVSTPVVLVHGAANSSSVWKYWQRALAERGFASYAIDLRGHGASDRIDLSRVSMRDYADDVAALIRQFAAPPIVLGWSMGGLAAMLAVEDTGARAFIGLAPSVPRRERNASVPLRSGTYGAEEYGIVVAGPERPQPVMFDLDPDERAVALASLCDESRYARDERAAGVVVRALPCPALIVTSTGDLQWPRANYDALHLPVTHLGVEGASHWGLLLNRRLLDGLVPRVLAWVDTAAPLPSAAAPTC